MINGNNLGLKAHFPASTTVSDVAVPLSARVETNYLSMRCRFSVVGVDWR